MEIEITIADAVKALGVTNFFLLGDPTSEAEFLEMYSHVTGEDEFGSAVLETDNSQWPVTWTAVKAKYDELVAAKPMQDLRKERNRRLAETDWWASSDLTMSSERTTYRQALRDITDSATSLDDVTWPTKP
tara:strand:+ start:700 stop:1092 length:393 start_codon:yes stop_codon:yes gene_type:complete